MELINSSAKASLSLLLFLLFGNLVHGQVFQDNAQNPPKALQLFDNLSKSWGQQLIHVLQRACEAGCCGKANSSSGSLPCCSSCETSLSLKEHGIPFSIDNITSEDVHLGCQCNNGLVEADCCTESDTTPVDGPVQESGSQTTPQVALSVQTLAQTEKPLPKTALTADFTISGCSCSGFPCPCPTDLANSILNEPTAASHSLTSKEGIASSFPNTDFTVPGSTCNGFPCPSLTLEEEIASSFPNADFTIPGSTCNGFPCPPAADLANAQFSEPTVAPLSLTLKAGVVSSLPNVDFTISGCTCGGFPCPCPAKQIKTQEPMASNIPLTSISHEHEEPELQIQHSDGSHNQRKCHCPGGHITTNCPCTDESARTPQIHAVKDEL